MHPRDVPITSLLPHGPRMTLIDRLESYSESGAVASADVRSGSVFFETTGVPAWAGIEYMAQTIAAHAGFAARLRGADPPLGFLIGTRSYTSDVDEFPRGARLTISVESDAAAAGVTAFRCSIALDRVVATAVINTYLPSPEEVARLRGAAGGA